MSAVSISVSQILPKYNNAESHANTFILKIVSPNKDQRKYGIIYCLLDIREDFVVSEPIAIELKHLLSTNYHNLSPSMSLSDRFERAMEVCNRYLQKLIDGGQIQASGIHIAIMAIIPSQILISSHGQVNGYYLDNTLGPLAKEKLEKIIDNSSSNDNSKKIFTQIDEIDLSPGMTFAFCSEAVLQLIEEKQLANALGLQNFDHIIKILAEQFDDSDVSGLINSEQIGLIVIRTNSVSSQQIAENSTAFIPKERMIEASKNINNISSNIARGRKPNTAIILIKNLPAKIMSIPTIFRPKHKSDKASINTDNSADNASTESRKTKKGLGTLLSAMQRGWHFFWYKIFSKNPRLYTFIIIIIVLYAIAEIYLF